MNNSRPALNLPQTDWQVLGELELSVDSSPQDAIQWLFGLLEPLALHAHVRGQVLQSAQEAGERAMRSARAAEFRHLHFVVYVPGPSASSGKAWGFFQIEKMGDSGQGGDPHDHAIEFYLYPAG